MPRAGRAHESTPTIKLAELATKRENSFMAFSYKLVGIGATIVVVERLFCPSYLVAAEDSARKRELPMKVL